MPADHVSDLLGAYALHALEPHEARLVEVHLETCAECRAEAEELGQAADSLALLAPPATAEPSLRERLLDRADEVASPARHPRRRVLAAAAVVIALVGAAGSGLLLVRTPRSVPSGERIALSTTTAGTMDLVLADDGQAYVIAVDVPRPEEDRIYEGWWMVDGQPRPAGTFHAGAGTTVQGLGPIDERAATFAVTVEESRRDTPAGPIVASADLRRS